MDVKMSGNQNDIDAKDKAAQEAKKSKFEQNLASADKRKPEEIKKLMENIIGSGLPPEMITSLLSTASSVLAEATKTAGQPSRGSLNGKQGNAEALKPIEEEKTRYESGAKKIYNDFDGFHESYLKKQTTYTSVLEEVLKETASGKDISPDLEKALKQAEEELKKDKDLTAQIKKTEQTAIEEQKYHVNKIIEVDKAKVGVSPSKLTPEQLDTVREFHVKCLDESNTKLAEVAKHYEERDKQAAVVKEGLKLAEKTQNIKFQNIWKQQEKLVLEEGLSISNDEIIKSTMQSKSGLKLNIEEEKSSIKNKSTKFAPELMNNLDKVRDTTKKYIVSNSTPRHQPIANEVKGQGRTSRGSGRGDF